MMEAITKPYWTDELFETLRDLHKKGLSASEISVLIPGGFTRNAIIGKIHRSGLAGNSAAYLARSISSGSRSYRRKVSRKPVLPIKPTTQSGYSIPKLRDLRDATAAMPKIAVTLDNPLPGDCAVGVGLMDLEKHMCRYPLTAEMPHKFCGLNREEGFPYCEAHAEICYAGIPKLPKLKPFKRVA